MGICLNIKILRKLNNMLNKYDEGTLDFTPNCPIYLLRNQSLHT
ncbi:MAG: hypothetical protein V8R30_05360 [Clostridia bacterium]